jgi:hypothetical protein
LLNYCVAEDVEGFQHEELAGLVVSVVMPVCDSNTSKMIAASVIDGNSGGHGGGLWK